VVDPMKRGTPLVCLAALVPIPVSRGLVWVLVLLVVAAGLALLFRYLRRRKDDAAARREAAEVAGETNRLLLSLLAHDLRSPLALADQGFQYVEQSVAGGYPIDRGMVADVRARLQRSLRAIEMVLSLAVKKRPEATEDGDSGPATTDVRAEIAGEVASFEYEAQARGKQLRAELDGVPDEPYHVDSLVLRQAIAIVLDNAVRYADPGVIRVAAVVNGSLLEVRVEDPGPGFRTPAASESAGGSGLGLRLCAALLTRAGGSLSTERDTPDGTVVAIRIPVVAAAEHFAPEPPALFAIV
jgi:signal transduction histidine kinase